MVKKPAKEVPETLNELFGRSLAGWQLSRAHLMELQHGLMGFFPAILNGGAFGKKSGEVVVVLDKRLLRVVWDHIEKARATITSFMVLACPEIGIAFGLCRNYTEETRAMKIFSEADLATLCGGKKEPFRWSPGLHGALGDYHPPDFDS